ncbi:site-specific integrase [Microbacterium sp. G2-8]|uniref:tyrosine-type recombinase/integrase n=1 Tax=Microbacterium sp. G2-8 TaxID=2842454 RepID=UPI001C8A696D|nr:site-specific integrase [Microbacterium sp. G2-8]
MASIRQRPNGSWRARYRDAAGKEHARHFPLKRDAQRWLDEQTAAIVTGQYADPAAGRITWSKWVEMWRGRQMWTDGTHEAAKTACKSVPWGDRPIKAIRASDVQSWVAAERKRGLAASTIKTRLNYVSMALGAAVADKRIPTNPAAGVSAPRQRRTEASMRLLDAEQLRAALAAADGFRPYVALCAFAGLRLGEAAGLRVRDIDFLRRTIRVEQQVQGSTLKTAKLVPPKYGEERTIYVPDELLRLLSAHLAENGGQGDDLVVVDPLGRMFNRNTAGGEWRRIRAAAKLPDEITLHALRHTFASNLIAAGCDVVTVQRALGHSQPSITLDTYSHLWPSAEDRTRAATADFAREILDSADSARTGT